MPADDAELVLGVPRGDLRADSGDPPVGPVADWTDPTRIPLGHVARVRLGGVVPDAEAIQANLFTLAQIGGLYDLIALEVERQHLAILIPWRLDSQAPRALDYIRARATRYRHPEGDTHAESNSTTGRV